MGLIGWIKKEIESNSRQRRQSAPPPSLYNQNNVNQHRDEAYMKAISRFNEWRNNQRFEKLNETKNASAITNAVSLQESIITADISISSIEIDDSEKQRLIEFRREQRRAKQNVRKLEHKVDFVMSQAQQRFSLPILKEPSDQKNRRKNKKITPTNTIDEIEEFEINHCKEMDGDFPMSVTSPPSKFYRQNSEPYTAEGKKKITPKKLMGRNMLRRAKSHNKGKAPPPPPPIDSESSSGFRNGNFKRYEIISSSAYDEFVKQSNIYKANLRRAEDPEKINSVGETGSSGSSSSDVEKNAKKNRRMSPPYLTVINKHGDEVEYALPYSERESLVTIPPLPDTLPPDQARINDFDRVINENFNFLKTHLDFSGHEDPKMKKSENEFDPVYTSFTDMPSRVVNKVQVTDLDRSNNTSLLKTPAQSGDIIKELDALSQWTNNLKNSMEKIGDQKFQVDDYMKINQKYRVFRSQDLHIKSGVFRNSQTLPLEFYFGFFNKTPVTTRSTIPDVYNDNGVADIASKRDFEILSQIHHQNIAIMMGINYDEDLRVMSLIMEPFEFTLNHYLHQMDHYFSIEQTISIVKQIAEAVQYIHESGFIHSNVNSHTILIRRFPFAVKLSSFELTTEILPRQSIEKIYRQKNIKEGEMSLMRLIPEETDLAEKYYKMSKHHFYNELTAKEFPAVDYEKESARLAYLIDFRRIFTTHFYQAPELLPSKNDFTYKFVLPTIRSDVFSLGLLLWEILNHCIPFVIYNYDELSTAYNKNEANLPLLDKSCISFMEIFNRCLHRNADERFSDVYKLIDMLNMADISSESEKVPYKNITDKKYYEKTPQKIYFNSGEKDLQKRAENAITAEKISNLKSTKSFSESIKSSELEAHVVSFSQQPEILNDNPVHRIKKSLENSAPKKPLRMKEDSPGMLEMSKRSDLFKSFFDLNRLETPKIDKNGIYGERTSTLKKRTKVDPVGKKSVKGLFDDNFDKMNSELEQITQNDFLDEIKQEMNERNREMSSFLNCGIHHHSIGDVSRSTDDIRKTLKSLKSPMKRSESDNIAGNESQLVDSDCRLPKTPIARQNRIRRNVWLSDSKKPSGGKISDSENFKPNKTVSEMSAPTKNYNVSIKIHRNDLDKDEENSSPLTKINNGDLNSSKYNVDINKKYYPMMPEMLCDVIRKRDKSMTNSIIEVDKVESEIKENKSFKAPIRSVRDAVKFIEATFTPNLQQSPKAKRTLLIESSPNPKIAHEETQTEKFFLPQLREKVIDDEKNNDEAKECMTKASQSIQKLSEIISTTSDNFPQIRQAQVTVNVQQITHRPSDIGQLKKFQEQNRHSICNSAELIKRWQMQIKTQTNSKSLCNVNKNDVVSASCSSLVAKSNDHISANNLQQQQQSGKCCKYFCRNCGFTMLPVEILQKMQSTGRLSVASSLQSIKGNEDGSQTLTKLRCCPKISETRSTEDIYIDDDFCQGISQSLAANMELLPPHDLFDSLNFNFFEFLQTQPHDWTLTEAETRGNNQLEWNEEGDNEEKTHIEDEEITKVDDINKTEEI